MPFALTVFTDPKNTYKRTNEVNILRNHFEVYIDAVNTDPILIKAKYAGSFHRFFAHDEDQLIMFDMEIIDLIEPEFIITFERELTEDEWDDILAFFENLLLEKKDIPAFLQDRLKEKEDKSAYLKFMDLIFVQKNCEMLIDKTEKEEPKLNDQYIFNMEIDEERDMGFFQIDKPFTDRPYTTIIRSFKEQGYLPVFTSLYIDSSWGLGPDNSFLAELWVHLGMNASTGILDLDSRINDHIRRCSPDNGVPEAEPEVYRISIQELKNQMSNKNKRYTEVIEDLRVKRVKRDSLGRLTNAPR